MYVIKSVYNGRQIYFVSREYNSKAKLPLVKFSTTINTATKYDNLDVALSKILELAHTHFAVYPVCPICNKDYEGGNSAISRVDIVTKICPDCSVRKALKDFAKVQK